MARRDFPITRNFKLSEFEVSAQHPELVEGVPDALLPDLIKLVVTGIQPIRERVGALEVLSGYRPPKLNRAVGGSASSQHMQAQAADLRSPRISAEDLFAQIWADSEKLNLGQVIYYPLQGFVHVALPSAKWREPTFFISRNGKVTRA